ncbi:MAG TPA: bifunctional glutamate N-acetyltransferase/amino-acid acetyltransferase ArgJ [Tepidisphaeraceae bacterium]|nr:bifunctional glutamate N-acetyltransferase/amino-acid acetyltransferase ArgJ [Tepidisphaeraceae bacterium]
MAQLHLLSPAGFRAAGVYAGIKTKNQPDVALLLCDRAATAAAVFTTNKVFAAPVKIGREHVKSGKLCGVVVNAGNANACTGKQGERDALRMCELAATVARCRRNLILPSSTGIIGHLLPMKKLERGIVEAGQYLGDSLEHAQLFSAAILTTDLKRKAAATSFKIGKQRVTLSGVCKGSGMIGPRMSLAGPHATMLAYLTTDASVAPPLLRKLLAASAEGSFNAVTVDDHTSTNDTACILASAASGAKVASAKEVKMFAAALDEVCRSLAYQIAADGEGATKVIVVTVRRAGNVAAARAMARAIANSPLVKCAMHGNDPNWGRIVSAAGLAGAAFDPAKCVLTLQNTVVFRAGRPVEFDASAVSETLEAPEVTVDLDCRAGTGEATMWTCDLSSEYVRINADYHT